MSGALVHRRNQLAEMREEEARLDRAALLASRVASQWRRRAMAAMRAGDDVVAKDALTRQETHARRAAELRTALLRHREHIEHLTRALALVERAAGHGPPLAKTSLVGPKKAEPMPHAASSGQRRTRR